MIAAIDQPHVCRTAKLSKCDSEIAECAQMCYGCLTKERQTECYHMRQTVTVLWLQALQRGACCAFRLAPGLLMAFLCHLQCASSAAKSQGCLYSNHWQQGLFATL